MLAVRSFPASISIAALLSACGSAPTGDAPNHDGPIFLAFASDFNGFHSWDAYPFEGTQGALPIHVSGPRTVYLNKRPPKGSSAFPMGTIIVKEVEDTPVLVDRKIFARVKRGGDYNSLGATGWEWFELKNQSDGSTGIVWRGVGPPAGECASYGGDASGCNPCHAAARDNDFVSTAALLLGSF